MREQKLNHLYMSGFHNVFANVSPQTRDSDQHVPGPGAKVKTAHGIVAGAGTAPGVTENITLEANREVGLAITDTASFSAEAPAGTKWSLQGLDVDIPGWERIAFAFTFSGGTPSPFSIHSLLIVWIV